MSAQLPEYNGWPNWPTWNIALWFGNDQGLSTLADEITAEICEDAEDRDAAIHTLAQRLEGECNEMLPEATGFTSDILRWALGFVDWRNIAEHYVDDHAAEIAGGDE